MFSQRSRLLRELQYQVVARDGVKCFYCGVVTLVKNSPAWKACRNPYPLERTVDHILPRIRGGLDVLENLRLACRSCNSVKGSGKRFVRKGA
jgi:5-methylcytosine-specific restriction endonuclease McrA